MDLMTNYLGIELKNPLVPSSSPITGDFDGARRLEDAGAAAIVLPSLFEEAVLAEEEQMTRFLDEQEIGHHEADSFFPEPVNFLSTLDQYLDRIEQYKQALQIPVIGSLNGTSLSGWLDHAKDLQSAGCDALELNLYGVNARVDESSTDIERRYINIVHQLAQTIDIPFTVKLSQEITALPHFVHSLETAGARGVSLFNRFYQSDIDLQTLAVQPHIQLSTPYEALLRIRWLAILRNQVQLSLATTGGFHQATDVLKAILAGADVVHLCSLLLKQGPETLGDLLVKIEQWLQDNEYESLQQAKGSLSYQHAVNPAAYERANYLQVLDSYKSNHGDETEEDYSS